MTSPDAPHLSIVLPAFNEQQRIGPCLEAVRSFVESYDRPVEVIVVDDGSRDGTVRLVRRRAGELGLGTPNGPARFRLIARGVNRGKGAAVRAGMQAARGRYALYADIDLSTPLETWRRFEAAHEAGADVCIGSRALDRRRILRRQPLWRDAMGRTFSLLKSLLVLPGIPDSQCGFKSFTEVARLALFSRQRLDRFAFDVELLVLARRLGLTIEQLPVDWSDSPASRVRPLRDSARMAVDLVRLRVALWSGAYHLEEGRRFIGSTAGSTR